MMEEMYKMIKDFPQKVSCFKIHKNNIRGRKENPIQCQVELYVKTEAFVSRFVDCSSSIQMADDLNWFCTRFHKI